MTPEPTVSPTASPPARRIGIFPWLPWPLAAMPSWTTPVRAERLAALRIALAAVLFCDVFTSYYPGRAMFFGPDSVGSLELYAYYARGERYHWSILRGPENDLNFTISLLAATGFLVWLGLQVRTRHFGDDPQPPRTSPWAVVGWVFFSSVATAGFWVRVFKSDAGPDSWLWVWIWLTPLLLACVSGCLWAAEAWGRRRTPRDTPAIRALWIATWLWFPLLTADGVLLRGQHWTADGPTNWLRTLLEPWLLSHDMIAACLIVWMTAIVFLAIGWKTRVAAVVVWAMSLSFANVQSSIDNAGDTIRDIILFYLMLCPCAAAWSVDSFRFRKSGPAVGPAVVSPWPICLLFTQMVLMYFLNGLGKVTSSDWLQGRTLYLVLHDLTLTRFSYVQLPMTYELTRILTWTTLWWELTFPLLVLWRPTRILALVMGVGFHIGIGLTMDLGFFAAYALCLYVPLLPWERLSRG